MVPDWAPIVYPDAEIKLYPTQDEVNLDMANGRLDLQVGDMIPLLDWVTKNDDGMACCELIGEPITDKKFVGEGVGIAVRQEDNDLREKLNAALKAIREDIDLTRHMDDAVQSLRICLAADESVRTGQTVKL